MSYRNDNEDGWWFGAGRGRGRGWGRGGGGGGGGEGGGGGGIRPPHPPHPPHPPGFPWRGGPWQRLREVFEERPPRADRGLVRYLVLDAISGQPSHGYEIMAAIEKMSQGAYRPSPGVIYPTLQLLEELEHVKVTAKDDKKVYAITAAGTEDLKEHRAEVEEFYEDAEDSFDPAQMVELAHSVRRLLRTVRRATRRGTLGATKMAKVRALLEETAAKLEELLGG